MAVEPFRIFELTAPGGGLIGIGRLPGRSGDLAGDVAAIVAWRASLVLSLTEAEEMAARGAGGLAEELAAAGLAHARLPIRDFGAPEAADARWPPLAASLHTRLDKAERLFLHCLGGQGRSGMVAMRLLVERGIKPDQALSAIRAVRPGAVETEAQRLWAVSGGSRSD